MQVSDTRLPYQERALDRRLSVIPRSSLTLADTYVSSVALMGDGVLPQLLPQSANGASFFGVASGVLAVGHAVTGIRTLAQSERHEDSKARNLRRLQGAADLVAAAGLAGQAFGLGPWTAALAVAGSLTATTTSCLRRTGA